MPASISRYEQSRLVSRKDPFHSCYAPAWEHTHLLFCLVHKSPRVTREHMHGVSFCFQQFWYLSPLKAFREHDVDTPYDVLVTVQYTMYLV